MGIYIMQLHCSLPVLNLFSSKHLQISCLIQFIMTKVTQIDVKHKI